MWWHFKWGFGEGLGIKGRTLERGQQDSHACKRARIFQARKRLKGQEVGTCSECSKNTKEAIGGW